MSASLDRLAGLCAALANGHLWSLHVISRPGAVDIEIEFGTIVDDEADESFQATGVALDEAVGDACAQCEARLKGEVLNEKGVR